MRREGTDVPEVVRFKFRRTPFHDIEDGEEKLPDKQKLVEFYICNTINHFHVQVPRKSDHRDVFPKILLPAIQRVCQCDGSCQSDGWEPTSLINHSWFIQMELIADFEDIIMFKPDPEPLELSGNGQNQPAGQAPMSPQTVIQTIAIHYRRYGREFIQTVPVDYRNQANELLAVGGMMVFPEPWTAIAAPINDAHTRMKEKLNAK